MNTSNRLARRYHWYSEKLENFVNEPHTAICCNQQGREVLNLVAEKSTKTRQISTEISHERPEKLIKIIEKLKNRPNVSIHQKSNLFMPKRHLISVKDLNPKALERTFLKTYERKAKNKDPARYSFAHGGKDGTPYPVNRKTYDSSITLLHDAIQKAKIEEREKIEAIKRLRLF